MNSRTPLLAVLLGSVVGLYVLVTVVNSFYLEPRRQILKDIEAQEALQNKLLLEQAGLRQVRRSWEKQTQRTLSTEPERAHPRFRDDITAMAKKHGLVGGHSLGERAVVEISRGPQKGFKKLPLSFSCAGSLKSLESFLLELYQMPYYVNVDKLTITPNPVEQGLTGSKKKDAPRDPDGPELRINMDLATLVLPRLPEVKAATFLEPLAAPASGPATATATQTSRPSSRPVTQPVTQPIENPPKYLREDPIEYAMITRTNLFKQYVPTRIVVDSTPKREPIDDKPPPPPPPPPPKPDTRVVLGTTGMAGDPIVFVREADDRLNPPTELRLNEAVSDDGRGHIVLIHPKGIVIRVKAKDAGQPAKNYFVALGSKLSDRVELAGAAQLEYPDVYYQLTRVLAQ
ncbi:MAG: hypothetical protein IT450_20695 [Phycisphaerales bacterium]|nr:hypothetical protein [Phycisphaerales bacterium]